MNVVDRDADLDLPPDPEVSGQEWSSWVERLTETQAGPELAELLATVDRGGLGPDELLEMARARQRLVAHQEAQLLADLHAVARAVPDEGPQWGRRDQPGKYPWAECEVASALRWTYRRAGDQLVLADELIDRLPRVFAALDAGSVDVPRALVVANLLACVDDTVAVAVADKVIDKASRQTTGELRARVRRLVLAADAQVAAKRAREGIGARRVAAYAHQDDHLATLAGYELSPPRVAAVMERLDAIAAAAKASGDTRSVDQLRADAFLDLLSGDGIGAGGPVSDGAAGIAGDGVHAPEAGTRHGDDSGHGEGSGHGDDGGSGGDDVPWPTVPADPGPLDDGDGQGADAEVQHGCIDPAPTDLWASGIPDPAEYVDAEAEVEAGGRKPVASSPAVPGSLPAPRAGVVELQVPLVTLLGLSQLPGELSGWGPVLADIARQVTGQMHAARWRFSVYDRLGELAYHGTTGARPTTEDGTRRRPSAEQAAFVRSRDRTCVAPGCQRAARRCDIDHTLDWAKGGPTECGNLGLLCRLHHLFKDASGCELQQVSPGVFVWSTPSGMQYLTTPHRPLIDDNELAGVPSADHRDPGG